jgi:hypothetical protein
MEMQYSEVIDAMRPQLEPTAHYQPARVAVMIEYDNANGLRTPIDQLESAYGSEVQELPNAFRLYNFMAFKAHKLRELKAMQHQRYDIITYDVWGNEREGYEVNAAYRAGNVDISLDMFLPSSESNLQLKREIKRIFGLNRNIRLSSLDLDYDYMTQDRPRCIRIEYAPTGFPIGELQLTND